MCPEDLRVKTNFNSKYNGKGVDRSDPQGVGDTVTTRNGSFNFKTNYRGHKVLHFSRDQSRVFQYFPQNIYEEVGVGTSVESVKKVWCAW